MSTRRFVAVTLALFITLTAVMTWPQVAHMKDGVHDPADPLMVTWILGWVAHQLPRAPAHLFDANIFYPERNTLAYSETLIVPGAIAAPLQWLGVGHVLVYNLVFLSGFAISGVGVALLVRRLTGCVAAAILAGIIFAFPPFRIDHYAHLQLQQTQFIPLSLWAFHRLLDRPRLSGGVLLGVFVACQMLSCMYYGLFLVPYMAVVCGTMVVARAFTRGGASDFRLPTSYLPRMLLSLAAAGAVAAVIMLPAARAYLGARDVVGERGRQEVADGSARLYNYLAPPEVNAVYGTMFERFRDPERRLFPGFVAIGLAIVGLFRGRGNTKETEDATKDTKKTELTKDTKDGYLKTPQFAYALGLLLALDVSLGFNGLIYRGLYDYFFPFRALRIPARMGIMVGFSLAVLAGYGVARIAGSIRSGGARRTVLVALGVLLLVEYASKPLPLWYAPLTPPAAYGDILRDRGDSPTAVLFEFPTGAMEDPEYLYYSTFHWQYLINGYSGFFPPSYLRIVRAMRNFPDQTSIDVMKSHGVRYLVIHGEWLSGDRYQELIPELDRRPDLALVSRHPWTRADKHAEISVYRVTYP